MPKRLEKKQRSRKARVRGCVSKSYVWQFEKELMVVCMLRLVPEEGPILRMEILGISYYVVESRGKERMFWVHIAVKGYISNQKHGECT